MAAEIWFDEEEEDANDIDWFSNKPWSIRDRP